MKIIYKSSMLMAGLIFLSFSLAAKTSTLYSFDDQIAKGTEALRQHDALLAKQYFVAAKKEGKGQQKKQARQLIRKMRYFETYCSTVKKGEQFTQSENYRYAYESYQKAQSTLVVSIRKHPIPDLDSEFSQRIKTSIQQVNRERKTAFQSAIDEGRQYLFQDDPHSALTAFQYAKGQMYRNELAEFDLLEIIADAQRKADYKDFLSKGNEYLTDGDLHSARNWFYKAKDKWETYEVANNIEEVEALLIEAYISEGESFFTVGAYEKALNSFQKAVKYNETDEVINWVNQTKDALYDQFLLEGDTLSEQQAYPQAIAAFQKAQAYWNTDEIKQRIRQANEAHYTFLVAIGQEALQQDSLEKALDYFHCAADVKSTASVKSLIAQTKDQLYQQFYANARDSIQRLAFPGALAVAKQALAYKATPEIQTLIQQAENGIEYDKHFYQGLKYFQNKEVDKAYQAFIEAKKFWVTEEVKAQLETLETLFANFDQYKTAGDQALHRGELETAIRQYKKAKDICLREGIDSKIQEIETRLEKYTDHLTQGKSAYDQDQAEQALQHFEQAAQYNRISEIENWIDRARRMPCTIAINLHGNTDKIDKTQLEVVDYYTLDILYKADPNSSNYTFPKVPGGGDKKYYLRAFLVENEQGKTAIKEVACDCSTQRKHEVSVAIE